MWKKAVFTRMKPEIDNMQPVFGSGGGCWDATIWVEVNDMKFGEKLQKLRKENGMSQEGLANQLNVSRQAVSKWENDQGYPEMEKMLLIGNLFQVSMDYLLKEDPQDEAGEREQGYYVSMECAQGFLHLEEKNAVKIGVGVLLLILSGLPSLLFPAMEDLMAIFALIFVALGICVFISMAFQENPYKMLEKEPLFFDFDVLQELKARERRMGKRYKALIMGGIGLIFLCCIIAIVIDDVLQITNGRFDAIYLLLIAFSVFTFIYAGCMMYNYALLTENKEYRAKRDDKEWLYYVTVGTAAVVYVGLGMLFGGLAWKTGWVLIVVVWIITAGYVRAKKGKSK